MTALTTIIRELETTDESELLGSAYQLDGDGQEPGPPYAHQVMGLDRMDRGGTLMPPVSGILHYPTGAGKTRVGMELIARALNQQAGHRFLWATHTKNLIRQSMVRMAELSRLFPKGTRFVWADADQAKDDEQDFHVVFMTRRALTNALDQAGDGRVKHRWRQHLLERGPMTLIYDECHQLGAEALQRNLRKFYESGITTGATKRWRVIGLSATPIPTRQEAIGLLQQYVFPVRQDAASTSHGWPVHVIQKVSNDALVKQGVLCPINLYLDKNGDFDVPSDLLRKVIGEARLRAPGATAQDTDIQKYALQFNSKVMADAGVIAFLAKKIGQNIALLGKTIVFVPNIEAANRMTGLLYEMFPAFRGRVAAVHSKMRELQVPGQEEASVHEVLDRFRHLGDQPSVLINVDMLTEGFDDPKVRTVVLARLTLSTNRFWQMIGRGTRGIAAKGTSDCNVIDPVKLTRLYDYFTGYQPSFSRNDEVEYEDCEEKGDDLASPVVPQVARPPDPSTGVYTVDPNLERLHAQVALALRHFLRGEQLSEVQAVEISCKARVKLSGGQVILESSSGVFEATTASAMLLGEVSNLERRAARDLGWFRQQLPMEITESLLKQRLRMLRAIESMNLWTDSAFAEAQMRGDFLAAMQQEAAGAQPDPQASPVPPPTPDALMKGRPSDIAEEAVLDAVLAIAGADGHVDDIEVLAISETLRRVCGRAPTPELEATIRTRAVPTAIPFDRVEVALSPEQRQLLLLQMIEVAAVDAVVTPAERAMLHAFATKCELPEAFVESVVGAHLARADVKTRAQASLTACASCGSDTPAEGAFCTSCGVRLT